MIICNLEKGAQNRTQPDILYCSFQEKIVKLKRVQQIKWDEQAARTKSDEIGD